MEALEGEEEVGLKEFLACFSPALLKKTSILGSNCSTMWGGGCVLCMSVVCGGEGLV